MYISFYALKYHFHTSKKIEFNKYLNSFFSFAQI